MEPDVIHIRPPKRMSVEHYTQPMYARPAILTRGAGLPAYLSMLIGRTADEEHYSMALPLTLQDMDFVGMIVATRILGALENFSEERFIAAMEVGAQWQNPPASGGYYDLIARAIGQRELDVLVGKPLDTDELDNLVFALTVGALPDLRFIGKAIERRMFPWRHMFFHFLAPPGPVDQYARAVKSRLDLLETKLMAVAKYRKVSRYSAYMSRFEEGLIQAMQRNIHVSQGIDVAFAVAFALAAHPDDLDIEITNAAWWCSKNFANVTRVMPLHIPATYKRNIRDLLAKWDSMEQHPLMEIPIQES